MDQGFLSLFSLKSFSLLSVLSEFRVLIYCFDIHMLMFEILIPSTSQQTLDLYGSTDFFVTLIMKNCSVLVTKLTTRSHMTYTALKEEKRQNAFSPGLSVKQT